jgi:hypothetical protein
MGFLNGESSTVLVILAIVGVTFFFVTSKPANSINGNVNIDTKTQFQAWRKDGDAAGTVRFKATKDIPAGSEFELDIYNNQLSSSPEQRDLRAKLGIVAREDRNRGGITTYNPPFDLGTWAGYAPEAKNEDKSSTFQVGVRIAPIRVLFDTIAPDALISSDHLGVGLSLYPPPDIVGDFWTHWGIGYGHLWPTSGGNPSNVFYLSFSTKTP